ncbi:MAG: hypothetical protein HYZ72_17845, partial [Deltaproteobacteria bacterium]|nr:hypothetical protein [Deltaproteobacteria bacterium]
RAILPSGDWKVRGGKIEIIFGEPIVIDPHMNKKAAREALLIKVREEIAAHHRPDTPPVSPASSPLGVPTPASEHQESSL